MSNHEIPEIQLEKRAEYDKQKEPTKTKDVEKHRLVWIGIRALLLAGLVLFCISVWPGYAFHSYLEITKYTSQVTQTSWLAAGDVVQQYFYPQYSRLSKIKMAFLFDENAAAEEYVIFEIKDKKGESIYRREIYFDQISSDCYFDIDVGGKKLKPREEYIWTLALPDGAAMDYSVMCQTAEDIISDENQTLWINGVDTQSNALNLYEYWKHPDKATIIGGFWTGALLVYLIFLEIVGRVEDYMKRKMSANRIPDFERYA